MLGLNILLILSAVLNILFLTALYWCISVWRTEPGVLLATIYGVALKNSTVTFDDKGKCTITPCPSWVDPTCPGCGGPLDDDEHSHGNHGKDS